MKPADLTAKAQRAAEWLSGRGEKCNPAGQRIENLWLLRGLILMNEEQMIVHAENIGWADPAQLDADEPSDAAYIALAEACEQEGMMGVKESEKLLNSIRSGNPPDGVDGVEWYATEEYAACNECELAVILTGDGFRWKAIPVEESNRRMVSGYAPTREEARRQAVAAARGMG